MINPLQAIHTSPLVIVVVDVCVEELQIMKIMTMKAGLIHLNTEETISEKKQGKLRELRT